MIHEIMTLLVVSRSVWFDITCILLLKAVYLGKSYQANWHCMWEDFDELDGGGRKCLRSPPTLLCFPDDLINLILLSSSNNSWEVAILLKV